MLETHELPSKAIPSNQMIPGDLAQDYNYSARKQQGSAPVQWHGKGQGEGPGGRGSLVGIAGDGWDPRIPSGCGRDGAAASPRLGTPKGHLSPAAGAGRQGQRARQGKSLQKQRRGSACGSHRRDRVSLAASRAGWRGWRRGRVAEPSPLPAHPRALRTLRRWHPAPVRASDRCPRYPVPRAQPYGGHPGPGVELHAGRHSSSRECCPLGPPAEPFKDGRAVPAPSRDPPGTATSPQPRGTAGWAGPAPLLTELPQRHCGLWAPSQGGTMLVITGEEISFVGLIRKQL